MQKALLFSYLFLTIHLIGRSQNINLGFGLGKSSFIIHDGKATLNDKYFMCYSFSGEFEKNSVIIGIYSELNFLKIRINENIGYWESYSHGQYQGQYSKSKTTTTLKYENDIPSLYTSINVGYHVRPKEQVSFVFGLNIGKSFALKQNIIKDSLIRERYSEYSNTPAGIYSESYSYTYGNSTSTDLKISTSNLFLSPSISMRIKFLKNRFICEIKGEILFHFSNLYFVSKSSSYSNEIYYSSNLLHVKISLLYRFKDLISKKATLS